MKKTALLIVFTALLLSCNNTPKEAESSTDDSVQQTSQVDATKIGRQNYAVVGNWATTDVKLMEDNAIAISNELTELWKNDIIENAYYNSGASVDKFAHFPNISFFMKANSLEEVKSTLDDLTIIKKGIIKYNIFPVGSLWLGRNADAINKKGMTKSYVTVWTNNKGIKPSEELKQEQFDTVLKHWNEGTVENVYFDIKGTQKANDVTDFVFYINANSEEEARKVAEGLPFFKKKAAAYKLHSVGVFWLGEYKK